LERLVERFDNHHERIWFTTGWFDKLTTIGFASPPNGSTSSPRTDLVHHEPMRGAKGGSDYPRSNLIPTPFVLSLSKDAPGVQGD
jgi:hypothetical protein